MGEKLSVLEVAFRVVNPSGVQRVEELLVEHDDLEGAIAFMRSKVEWAYDEDDMTLERYKECCALLEGLES